MKRAIHLIVFMIIGTFLIYCGGTKKMTPDELARLSPQERIAYLEKSRQKNPGDIQMRKDLYKEYLQLNMDEQAISVMNEIIELDPYQAEVQFDYGRVMVTRGETTPAYEAFRNALQSPGGSAYTGRISDFVGGSYIVQQVTSSAADEAFACFSADGNKIVYQTNENDNWDIIERELSTGSVRYLLNSPADEELPCLNADGSLLVYSSNIDDRRPIDNKFKVREIYLLEINGGFTRNLTETVADDWLPRFSHDGSQIVFASERSDLRSVPYTEKKSDVYSMESDGDFHRRLTSNDYNEGGANFSIDDKHIYFHSNRNGSYDIFVMNSDGTTQMTVLGQPDENEVSPFMAPDSQHIVFFSDRNGNYDIYRAPIDGSHVERLTSHPARDTHPVCSPDGKTIAFHSDRSGNFDIFFINLEATGEPTTQELITRLNNYLNQ